MLSKQTFILLALIYCFAAQEYLQDSVAAGGWSGIFKENRVLPRYYLCGAQMSQYRSITNHPQVCVQNCRKVRHWIAWRRTVCDTVCKPAYQTENWIRGDGILLTFCNFLNWNDQFVLGDRGTMPFQGRRMCPPNQLVYGFQAKLSDRDGLSGLSLYCKNPQISSQNSAINIINGNLGTWYPPKLSSGYAIGFEVKRAGYNAGFRAHFRSIPLIHSFELKYEVPTNIQATPQTIDTIVVINRGQSFMKKTIEFTKDREFQRIWMNEKGEWRGQVLSRHFTQSYSVKASLNILRIFTASDTKTNTIQTKTVSSYERMDKFAFGQSERVTVGQKQKDEIEVKPCTKKIISQIVYSSTVDIPYTASIGFTNGVTTQVDLIRGYYRGVLTSNVETTIDEEQIC